MWKILFSFFISVTTFAQTTQDAVKDVQSKLNDKNARQKMITTPEAKKATDYATQVTGGGANEDELYRLTSEILASMQNMTPEQMNDFVKKAQQNPEAFYNSLSPEMKKKIKELSGRVPSSTKTNP